MVSSRHIRPIARGPEPPPVIARGFIALVLATGALVGAAVTAALHCWRS